MPNPNPALPAQNVRTNTDGVYSEYLESYVQANAINSASSLYDNRTNQLFYEISVVVNQVSKGVRHR